MIDALVFPQRSHLLFIEIEFRDPGVAIVGGEFSSIFFSPEAESAEARLAGYLEPRDWLSELTGP